MATKTMPTHVRGSAEDRARAEITMWELDYEMEERSDISLRRGLVACIRRWRRDSTNSGDYMTAEHCTELLVSLGEDS
jgi:hypothetical protein